jgi:hypothetical protein
MEKVMRREDIIAALEMADVFDGEDAIVPAYRGRGGDKEGFGIKFDGMSYAFAFFAALGGNGGIQDQWADDVEDDASYLTSERAYELACAGRNDSMAFKNLVYFPGWTLV